MKRLKDKQAELLRGLQMSAYFLKGSIGDFCGNCHRAKCICDVKTEKRSFRLTYKDKNQKTRVLYVPRTRVSEVEKLMANNSRLRKILDQLFELNIRIFKESG